MSVCTQWVTEARDWDDAPEWGEVPADEYGEDAGAWLFERLKGATDGD